MRGVLDLCSAIRRGCYRAVVVSLRKRVRLVAVLVLLSLLIAALPGSSGRARANGTRTTAGSAQESLPLQFYRSMRTAFAAVGTWMAESLSSESAAPASTYQPVTAYLSPAPPFIDAPTNLTTTATTDTSISLSWTPPAGSVAHYQIERSQSVSGPFLFRATTTNTTFQDTTVTTDQAYLYRVRAVTSGGVPSVPSNMGLATATSFEFNGETTLQGKTVKKQHVYDIRTAINAVRLVAGLATATWGRTDLTNLQIEANDVQELRTRLGEALIVLEISVAAYADSTLNIGVTPIRATHVDQLQVRSTRGSSNSSGPIDSDSSTARLDPFNQTGGGGENPLSRNFNWNLPLVGLPGRGGLDLGLTLSYNSLVWTKAGNTVSFDTDFGFPGPGFRLGFPVIQHPAYSNSEVGKNAYLMIGTDGSRTELRQVSTSGVGATLYEAADSSHLLLDTTTLTLRTSDGTQLKYELKGVDYKCTKITDRNGNFITVNYTTAGNIDEVVDTLGRHIDFVYDANGWLTQIKQLWNSGAVTQYWARFEYTNTTIDTNFWDPNLGSMTVFGPADTTQIKTLSKVTLPDNSYHQFSYTSWGQVWKITNFGADNSPINYRSYDLPLTGGTAHQDCPRFMARKDWAKYWNGDTDGTTAANEEATTSFIVPASDNWVMPGPESTQLSGVRAQVTTPDGTINKLYFVGSAGSQTGWSRGLPILVDTVSGGVPQRRTATTWTQDDTSVSYPLNPRVLETNIYDAVGNRARTEISYQQFTFSNTTSCWLPRDVFEYAADATTKLRTARTNYNSSAAYTDRRILGLPSERLLYQGAVSSTPVSRVEFIYDTLASIQGNDVPVQHDSTYDGDFVNRGNVFQVKRYNVDSPSESTITETKYNTAGAAVLLKDAAGHQTQISYTDSFSDGIARTTLAYPTTVTDPDNYTATAKYNFDFGSPTYKRTPLPGGTANTPGPEQTFTYDAIGRIQQITNLVNNAHTRFVYSSGSQLKTETYQTFQAGLEAHEFEITDGAGRVIGSAVQHPGSVGGYSGQRNFYNVMGRRIKTSNFTETSASGTPFQWTTAGDDASAGWIYTEQTYDWKGRPLVTTNPSITGNPAEPTTKTISYFGCGCAGGDVVTTIDEGTISGGAEKRRKTKTYSDSLGRTIKTEVFNWENGSEYTATVNTYNARDQLMLSRQYSGPEGGSSPYQDTTRTYDGYGRLHTQHLPEQQFDPTIPNSSDHTTWTYNADDTLNTIKDARGAVSTYGYAGTNRHLIKTITSTLSGSPTTNTSFTYDSVGNRLSMTDDSGTTSYAYNQLSQITSETRTFAGRPGSFTITYGGYNLGGSLLSLTDPFGDQVTYQYDVSGRPASIGGSGYEAGWFDHSTMQLITAPVTSFVSEYKYRAWGAHKQITYGNGVYETFSYNARLAPTQFNVNNMRTTVPANPSFTRTYNYDYYNDLTLNHAYDLTDTKFDRRHEYGPDGRMIEAYTNREARGLSYSTSDPDPYRRSTQYDVWGNITSISGRFWNLVQGDTATYLNNRRQGVLHDPEGHQAPEYHIYSAMNKQVHYKSSENAGGCCGFPALPTMEIIQNYDGLGQPASNRQIIRTEVWVPGENGPELQTVNTTDETLYMVRSTVLGGAVIAELVPGAGGQLVKLRINIYGHNNQRIAKEENSEIKFEHNTPIGSTTFDVGAHSNHREITEITELDPSGAFISRGDPMTTDFLELGAGRPFQESGNPFDLVDGCTLDQISIDCSFLDRLKRADGVQTESLIHHPKERYYHPGDPNPHYTPGRFEFVRGDIVDRGAGLFLYKARRSYLLEGTATSPETLDYDRYADFRDYAFQLVRNGDPNDCLKLALLAYKAGQVFGSSAIHGLQAGLTETSGVAGTSDANYRVGVFSRDTYFGGGFHDGGFISMYQDRPPGGNQVRHFVGWFAAGAFAGPRVARRELYRIERTNSMANADVALGMQAINMGFEFSKTGDYKALAQAIWKDLCGQKTQLNLP